MLRWVYTITVNIYKRETSEIITNLNSVVMHPKPVEGMENSVDAEETASEQTAVWSQSALFAYLSEFYGLFYMSLVTRKPVFGVRLKPPSSAAETS